MEVLGAGIHEMSGLRLRGHEEDTMKITNFGPDCSRGMELATPTGRLAQARACEKNRAVA